MQTATVMIDGGVIFALGAAFVLCAERRLSKTGERVPGIVVALIDSSDAESDSYRPVLRFRTGDGREIRAVASVTSGHSPRPGTDVPVIYDPANPENASIDTWYDRGMWLGPLVLAIGLALIAWGAYRFATGAA